MIDQIKERLGVRSGLVRDIAAVSGSRLIRQAALMITVAIAARALGKELVGVWALIYVVLQFGVLLSDSGISTFVVRQRDLPSRMISTAFTISLALSFLVAALVALLAIPLARLLSLEDYTWHFCVAAMTIIPLNATGVLQAKMRRQKRFTEILLSEVVSSVVLLVAVGWMLWSQLGLWAFVLGTLLSCVAGLTVSAYFAGIPRPTVDRDCIKEITNYSLGIVGFATVNHWARNLDHILIGKFLGAAPLGVYSVAYRIMMLPLSQINATAHAVALPYLAPHQDNPAKMRESIRSILVVIGMLTTIPMTWIWLERESLVRLLLGDGWDEVAQLLLVLAPVAVLQSLVNPIGLCFLVSGKTNRLFGFGLLNTLVTTIGFGVGVWLGNLEWVVCCYAVANLLMAPITVGLGLSTIGGRVRDWFRWSLPFLTCLPCCLAVDLLTPDFESAFLHAIKSFAVTAFVGSIAYRHAYRSTFGLSRLNPMVNDDRSVNDSRSVRNGVTA